MIRFFALFMFLCVAMAGPSFAQSIKPVFRNVIWGASQEDVRKYETALFYDDRDGLSFFEDTNVSRMVYRYDFREGRLWRIRVNYMDFHRTSPHEVLSVVADEKIRLEKQYGTPVRDGLIWLDSSYRNVAPWFERAFAMGKVRVETEWQTQDTHILFKALHNGSGYDLSYTLEHKTEADEAAQPFEVLKFND